MKVGILFILCFWIHLGFSQNYADSALSLYTKIEIDSLPQPERDILATTRLFFEEGASDSLVLEGISEIAASIETPEVSNLFNDLIGRFCETRLGETLSEVDRLFYLKHHSIFFQNQSFFFSYSTQLEKSLEAKYKSLVIREQIKDTGLVITSLIDFGIVYFNNNEFEKAEDWVKRAYHIQLIFGDSIGLGRTNFILGAIMIKQGKSRESLPYLKQNLAFVRKNGDPEMIGEVLEGIGHAYQNLQELDSALHYFEKAYLKFQEAGRTERYSNILTSLGKISISLKDWENAEKYGLAALDVAKRFKYPSFEKNAAHILQKVYREKGDYKKSLEMLQLFYYIKDSMQSESNTQALLEKEYKYEYQRKVQLDSLKNAQVFALQVAENKSSKRVAYFLWGGLGLTLLFGFILLNRFRITQKQKGIIEEEKAKLDLANEQLKELDKEKSRFFTNISHEFRTPMTVISGMTDQIEREPEKWQKKGLEMIRRNSQQVLRLINQILDLRKLEAGNMELSLVQGNVVPFLRYLNESLHSYAEQKSVELNFQASTPSIMMDYDPEKLQAVIVNLLSNAIKFTPESGEVSMQCAVSSSQSSVASMQSKNPIPPTANYLQLTITDNGRGIPAAKLPYIFERFYQVDDSSTREGEGTGIGLALAKELVGLLGGNITVESIEGEGSSFTVSLPITQHAPLDQVDERAEAPLPIPPNPEKTLISTAETSKDLPSLLIVEDNEDVVQYLSACLEDSYQLLIARNGQEGIDMAIESVPDIIISDVMMPLKDGYEVCQTLKEDERTSHIPIILLTAKADVESRISGLKRGADAYLAKPFNPEELQVRLGMLVRLRQSLQQRYATISDGLPATQDATLQVEDAFIQKLHSGIMERLDDSNLNVSELCAIMGMSRTQLHNKLKALTGLSTTRYLRSVRMKEAQKLLQNIDLRIADIAYQVGFNDPAYFSNMFTKEFGISPREARNSSD